MPDNECKDIIYFLSMQTICIQLKFLEVRGPHLHPLNIRSMAYQWQLDLVVIDSLPCGLPGLPGTQSNQPLQIGLCPPEDMIKF